MLSYLNSKLFVLEISGLFLHLKNVKKIWICFSCILYQNIINSTWWSYWGHNNHRTFIMFTDLKVEAVLLTVIYFNIIFSTHTKYFNIFLNIVWKAIHRLVKYSKKKTMKNEIQMPFKCIEYLLTFLVHRIFLDFS